MHGNKTWSWWVSQLMGLSKQKRSMVMGTTTTNDHDDQSNAATSRFVKPLPPSYVSHPLGIDDIGMKIVLHFDSYINTYAYFETLWCGTLNGLLLSQRNLAAASCLRCDKAYTYIMPDDISSQSPGNFHMKGWMHWVPYKTHLAGLWPKYSTGRRREWFRRRRKF